MEDYYFSGNRVPAFGSWDCNEGLPFTECFERARQARLLRCTYAEDRDLYAAGDLYDHNDVVTPAMILVPRRRVKQGKLRGRDPWVVCDSEMGVKEPPSPLTPSPPRRAPKAVDEDLYQISPDLLHARHTRKRTWGFLSSCLRPSCVQ